MKFASHLAAAFTAQAGGLTFVLLVAYLFQLVMGQTNFIDIQLVGILALISLAGLIIVGFPAIFFLCLTNQNTRPLVTSFAGVMGGLTYLGIALLQEGHLEFPGWVPILLACIHGGASGFCFAKLSIQLEERQGPLWSRFEKDA